MRARSPQPGSRLAGAESAGTGTELPTLTTKGQLLALYR
jgi:hypothetical protein